VNSSSWNSINAIAMVLSAIVLWSGSAAAQSDASIPEAVLREPWSRQLAVVQSLSGPVAAVDAERRRPLGDALENLERELGKYETQVDRVIDRIVSNPEFSYVAAETSEELSAQIAEVHARFDALYTLLGVRERDDVRVAQESLDMLQRVLHAQKPFESDVLRALGSGSRTLIVELATRWWNGEERAIAVKKAVADLRQRLGGGSESQKPR
jgi:hypothetical protein